jgi:hemerythrin-like domain-containing protein
MKRASESGKPLPAAGDAFMQALRVDHGRLSRVLREIDAQQAKLQATPESARPVLADAMNYLLHYQHAFHHPREDRLFERISSRAPQFGREMRALMREHRGGLQLAEKLEADLRHATVAGLRGRTGARLAHRLTDYVAHTRAHMRAEESVFYAESERVLDRSDWVWLLAESTPDDPLGNQALLAKDYPHLAERLFQAVSEVGGRGDSAWRAGSATERARGAVREGVEQLVELYGELFQDGVEVVRANWATLQSARWPWGLVRAAAPVGARSWRFAVRCLADPPRLALATAGRFVGAWRPVGRDAGPGASQDAR